jgi:hypothetical protein
MNVPEWLKPGLRTLRFTWRQATARQRVLPDYIIAGAQKAGTTSLFRYLAQHPSVVRRKGKEVHYFDNNFARGPGWYRAHFPHRWVVRGESISGEASPYYLDHPLAAARCFELLPRARIIFLLRDPVDRAYSHYHHAVAKGFESLTTFEAALEAEPARCAGEIERMLKDPTYYSFAHHHLSYRARSRYVEHLERWLDHYPREQVHVVASERMREQPARVFQEILAFLGLSPWCPARFEIHGKRRSDARIDPATRSWLVREFAPANERLFRLLGQRFDWSTPEPAADSLPACGEEA